LDDIFSCAVMETRFCNWLSVNVGRARESEPGKWFRTPEQFKKLSLYLQMSIP